MSAKLLTCWQVEPSATWPGQLLQGGPVAAVPDVAFGGAVTVAGKVVLGLELREVHDGGTAVVAGENQDGVLLQPGFLRLPDQPANEGVQLKYKTAIRSNGTAAFKFLGGQQGPWTAGVG